jgi:hypothetical protein
LRDANRVVRSLEAAAGLMAESASVAEALEVAHEHVAMAEAEWERHRSDHAQAQTVLEQARCELDAARRAQLAAGQRREVAALRERRAAAVAALSTLMEAHRRVVESTIDEAALHDLEAAALAVERAEAVAGAGRPWVRLRALDQVSVVADGVRIDLPAGHEHVVVAAPTTTLGVPGLLEIEVDAGGDAATREAAVIRAREQLADRCRSLAVADLSEARGRVAARAAAERDAATARAQLDGFGVRVPPGARPGPELLIRLDAEIAERATGGEAGTGGVPPVDDDALAAAAAAADVAVAECQAALDEATVRLEAAREAARAAVLTREKLTARAEALVRSRAQIADRLLDDGHDPAVLDDPERGTELLTVAVAAQAAAGRAAAEAQRCLDEAAPEAARPAATAAQARLQEVTATLDARSGDLRQARGALDALGGEGLFEQAQRAEVALAHAKVALRRVEARAAAAQLLHDELRAARDEARTGYLDPLRARIVELGRVLHGETFDVELDDDLRIATRTLDGTTVPFADLSLGAREQLSLLSRLACGLLVSDEGGVPLILDDTLGSSDEGRLKRMAEVLSLAGEHCQVIILTCLPERFAGIHGARTITLV